MKDKFTHYGWFSFCPIYIKNPEDACPDVAVRHPWLRPLFMLALALQRVRIGTCQMFFPDWTPVFLLRVTGSIR